jgi:hypothetical protein
VGREVTPGVRLGGDLGDRAGREAPLAIDEHGRGVGCGGLEGEPVRGVRCRRPQLAPGLVGAPARGVQRGERVPITLLAAGVDQAEQLVEVALADGVVLDEEKQFTDELARALNIDDKKASDILEEIRSLEPDEG